MSLAIRRHIFVCSSANIFMNFLILISFEVFGKNIYIPGPRYCFPDLEYKIPGDTTMFERRTKALEAVVSGTDMITTIFSTGHGRWVEVRHVGASGKTYRTYAAARGLSQESDLDDIIPFMYENELSECLKEALGIINTCPPKDLGGFLVMFDGKYYAQKPFDRENPLPYGPNFCTNNIEINPKCLLGFDTQEVFLYRIFDCPTSIPCHMNYPHVTIDI